MRRIFELLYGVYAALALGAVLFLFTCPLIIMGPTLALRRWAGRAGLRAAFAAALIPFRVRGVERLPAGPCFVVSNHASYLDGLIMTAALPARFTFVVQHGAASWPLVGLVIKRMGVSFINRGAAREGARQTRALIRRSESGESLVVFPEGTFENPPGLLPFRNGAFLMAVRAGVPVVPAVIRGSRRVLGGGRRWLHHGSIEVEVFDPLTPGSGPQAAAELRDAARAVVLAHCGEPDASLPLRERADKVPDPVSGCDRDARSARREGRV